MTIVNHLVNDLVDQNKVLANTLLVKHSAVVPEHLHHSVEDIEDSRWLDVVFGGRNEVDAEFFGEEVIDSVNILKKRGNKLSDKANLSNISKHLYLQK